MARELIPINGSETEDPSEQSKLEELGDCRRPRADPNVGWTCADFSPERKRIIRSAKERAKLAREGGLNYLDGGPLGTPVQDLIIDYQASSDEVVYPFDHKKRHSAIVFGKDKAKSTPPFGGYNEWQGSYSIDIVAGRLSSQRGKINDGIVVQGPNFITDAARIYISQRTDIDTIFGLTEGIGGNSIGHSGIGIKADAVRIIGREGIKIVTGRMGGVKGAGRRGEKNSKGGNLPAAGPIELIAGNSTKDRQVTTGSPDGGTETIKTLQPLLKGDNTVAAFKELSEILDRIIGSMMNLTLLQTTFNSTIGITIYPLAHYPSIAATTATQLLANVQNSLWNSRINKTMWEINHLETFGGKYICSKNVFTT